MRFLVQSGNVRLKIVAPVPWFPSTASLFPNYKKYALAPRTNVRYGINILHPRYPVLPKVGMSVSPMFLSSFCFGTVKKIIKSGFNFDIIDAYNFYPDGVAATILGKYFGKPVIITAFGTDINLIPRYPIPRKMIRWAGQQAVAMTSVCEALKDRMIELSINRQKISVILHGVDLNLFAPPKDRSNLRRVLGFTNTTLISVGHLTERKGHDLVIRALLELPDCRLFIIGDGEEEFRLKKLTSDLKVSDRVRFLGHVDQEKLPMYYGAADLLVLASSREGIANVLIESMACGTPVVATSVWGSPEAITTPDAGALVPERTPEALSYGILTVLRNYPDRAATRRHAEQFSWYKTTRQHLTLYEQALRIQTEA